MDHLTQRMLQFGINVPAGIALLALSILSIKLAPGADVDGRQAVPATSPSSFPTTAPAEPEVVPTSPEIERLLKLIGMEDWHVREQAERRLAALGEFAAPRLQQFALSPGDAEARAQAELALLRIETARPPASTLLTLSFKDAPPQAVFAELSRHLPYPILPQRQGLWDSARKSTVSLELDRTPFWPAMRTICRQLGFRTLFINEVEGNSQGPTRLILTRDMAGEMDSPACVDGSFMTLLTSLHRSASGGHAVGGNLTVQVTFFADPRWKILKRPEQAVVERVSDDAGRPIPPPESMHIQTDREESPIWMMGTDIPHIPPDCQMLSELTGSIRLSVLGNESEPLKVPDIMSVRNIVKHLGTRSVQIKETVREGESYKVRLTVFRNGLSPQAWRQSRELAGIQLLDRHGRPLTRGGVEADGDGDQVDYELVFNRTQTQPAGGKDADDEFAPATLTIELPLEPKTVTIPFSFKNMKIDAN